MTKERSSDAQTSRHSSRRGSFERVILWERPPASRLAPAPDLTYDIVNHYSDYKAYGTDPEKCRWIHKVPLISMVKESLTRAISHFPINAGENPTICACIKLALIDFQEEDAITELTMARERFFLLPSDIDPYVYSAIKSHIGTERWDLENLPKCPQASHKNVGSPPAIHESLRSAAKSLGLGINSLALLCLMQTLSKQETTLDSDRPIMEGHINSFLNHCKIRAHTGFALIGHFGFNDLVPENLPSPEIRK